MTPPNTPRDDDIEMDGYREVVPEVQPPAPDAVPAASASSTMPMRLAARRRAWTVVAIVLMAIVTLVAFGALIWQALRPR